MSKVNVPELIAEIEKYCDESKSNSPVCMSILGGKAVSTRPLGDLMDLFTTSDVQLTAEEKKVGYDAFVEATGLEITPSTDLSPMLQEVVKSTNYYVLLTVCVVAIIFILSFIAFGWISGVVGTMLIVLVIMVVYSFSIGYRTYIEGWLKDHRPIVPVPPVSAKALEDSIALWPIGFAESSRAINQKRGGISKVKENTNNNNTSEHGIVIDPKQRSNERNAHRKLR